MSEVTLEQLRTAASEQGVPGSEPYDAALVLLAGLVVGANQERIHAFTGVDKRRIQQFGHRLRKNGIWQGSKTVGGADWFEDEDGGMAFALDVSVAIGFVERVPA
jgi:hypothetical protein